MVMTVSNIQRMFESSKVEGGGIAALVAAAAVGYTDVSAEVSPVEEGGGGTTPEDLTLGRLELALI